MAIFPEVKFKQSIEQAQSYGEWRSAAMAYDEHTGKQRWREEEKSDLYDYQSIKARLQQLRQLRQEDDHHGLLFALNEGIHGNMGGMGSDKLYQQAQFGTKVLIEEYVEELTSSLRAIASSEFSDISWEEKHDFFERASHSFGQSALMMSGSGMLAYFHLGVIKALWKENLLPTVMSGSSGGSFIGAIAVSYSQKELKRLFNPKLLAAHNLSPFGWLGKYTPKVLPVEEVRSMVERFIPDITFEEAFEKTGRHLNVSIAPSETHQTSRLLNAITSPHVLLREAVLASCALPGVYPPVMLMAKDKQGKKRPYLPNRKWVDGAISDDLPAKRLARLYGVNHYIVSQTNPHILPFISDTKRSSSLPSIVVGAASRTTREWLNAGVSLIQQPLNYLPKINQATNTVMSIINQDYIGDINIIPPFKFKNPLRLLAPLSEAEIEELMDIGERACWPKLEMIRIQTSVSRELSRIQWDLHHTGSHI